MKKFNLSHDMFSKAEFELYKDDDFKVTTFTYPSGIEAMKVENSRGYLTLLPFHGLIIWDAIFDGVSLKMKDMFKQPLLGPGIADTYGCFQFTSGLLANGTPGPEDDYQLHGEFPTSDMDHSYITLEDGEMTVHSDYEYVKGFGYHYLAEPSVTMHKGSGLFDIRLKVTNLSNYQPMPLQYLCHMNYAYVDNAKMSSNIPDEDFQLRQTIPSHVHPTPEWTKYNDALKASGKLINQLDDPDHYDPEIVFFSKDLSQITPEAEFRVDIGDGKNFLTKFDTSEFPIATRWILYNADQQVNAFAIPGTSTPEGFTAAKKAGTLISLKAQESRSFKVTTGLEN
ncbi:aldose 1-epimerase family protein [Secundilactobacillus yichangensis]|uniref:aldose 1-epimerase family protein n=1 Tax=Secundilactobacillus yichangensis TaxID=2799580 RepID=UPI001944E6A4|nr:aldose 1-epimerase family protein [Secundilactobacillus yichangensis]